MQSRKASGIISVIPSPNTNSLREEQLANAYSQTHVTVEGMTTFSIFSLFAKLEIPVTGFPSILSGMTTVLSVPKYPFIEPLESFTKISKSETGDSFGGTVSLSGGVLSVLGGVFSSTGSLLHPTKESDERIQNMSIKQIDFLII